MDYAGKRKTTRREVFLEEVATAKRIAADLGIDSVLADVLPAQKAQKIKELHASGSARNRRAVKAAEVASGADCWIAGPSIKPVTVAGSRTFSTLESPRLRICNPHVAVIGRRVIRISLRCLFFACCLPG